MDPLLIFLFSIIHNPLLEQKKKNDVASSLNSSSKIYLIKDLRNEDHLLFTSKINYWLDLIVTSNYHISKNKTKIKISRLIPCFNQIYKAHYCPDSEYFLP